MLVVWDLLDRKDVDAAAALLERILTNHLLSPDLHFARAFVARSRGDTSARELESYFAGVLRDALLATGDGSQQRPFVVTRVDEEYTILRALKLTPSRVSAAIAGDRILDVIHTRERGPIFFDATTALEAYRP